MNLVISYAMLAASALIAASWQGLVLAAGVTLLLMVLPGLSASRRWIVWSGVFLLVAALHLLQLELFHVEQSGSAAHAGSAAVHLRLAWGLALASVWCALTILRFSQLISGALHLRRLARAAVPVALPADCRALIAAEPRRTEVCSSPAVTRPSVAGFFHPRVLLPASLLDRLTADELKQVLLHELGHIRRGDDWTNLLQKLALALFPLNPALFWVERRLCAERELACDDQVVRLTGARKAYAACLTRLAEGAAVSRGVQLALGAWARRPELARRVYRLLAQTRPERSSRWAGWTVASVMAVVLCGSIALSRSPELVSFAPAAALPPMTVSVLPAGYSYARSQPARATLVSAHLPLSSSVQVSPRPARVRHAHTQVLKPIAPRHLMLTRALRGTPANPSSLQLTGFEAAQVSPVPVLVRVTWTAVVPVANGWIVFQL